MESERVLNWKDSVHFVTQILRALQHAHERGIVHRDIKPQNIMMFTDGTIKVMDFGIAKFAREEGRTATDQAIGTVHYISPEQARGDVTDAKSDLYSVGVMLYEMLTGQKPFDTDNPVSIAVMHMQNIAELPRHINPDIPEPIEEIIVHAMEKNPNDRYQTANEMIRDIDRFKADPYVNFGYIKKSPEESTRYFSAVQNPDSAVYEDEEEYEGDNYLYDDQQDVVYSNEYDEDYSDFSEEETEKSRSLFVPVLSAVTVVVIMVAVLLITMVVKDMFNGGSEPKTTQFVMRNLVGMDYNQAVESYSKYIDIQVEAQEWSELERDKIFEQSIPEGEAVKKGEIVKVKVSLGQKTVKVPNVINYHYITAGEALRAEGLEVEYKYQANKDVDEELVFDTEPAALEEVAPGTTVLVYVSKGSDVEEIEMEDFVGKSIDDAKVQCGIWGISVKTEKKASSKEKGTILKQSIEAGEKVPSDSTITFTVSTGEEPEGDVDITVYFPDDATGRFRLSAYHNNTPIYESFTLSADYTKENPMKITYKGTDVHVTIVLTNLSNGLTAVLGEYNMNFEDGTFSTVRESIYEAFGTVDGLYVAPTEPPAPAPNPDSEPQTPETDAPTEAEDENSDEE